MQGSCCLKGAFCMKWAYLGKRLLIAALTILIIITINFFLVNSMPGDPLVNILGDEEYYKIKNDNPEILEHIREKYGLDENIFVRYGKYVKSIVTLDFGFSYVKKMPVLDVIRHRLHWTLVLAIPATILSALLGGWLGVKAGWKQGGLLDRIATPTALFLNTLPTNCIAILFLSWFSYRLGWFPIAGVTSGGLHGLEKVVDVLWHMTLPLIIMVILRSSGNFIHMKSYMSKIKSEEYVLTAVSKGLSDQKVLRRHALKNCILPYLTIISMQFGSIVSGSVIIETVFSWIGMGDLMNKSIASSDFPMMQFCFLMTAACSVLANLAADVLYVLIDPRIREENAG